jgi:hypothetical protein
MVDEIADKPEWRRRVFNEETAKWRTETITEAGQGFSGKMFEYVRISYHIEISLAVPLIKT